MGTGGSASCADDDRLQSSSLQNSLRKSKMSSPTSWSVSGHIVTQLRAQMGESSGGAFFSSGF